AEIVGGVEHRLGLLAELGQLVLGFFQGVGGLGDGVLQVLVGVDLLGEGGTEGGGLVAGLAIGVAELFVGVLRSLDDLFLGLHLFGLVGKLFLQLFALRYGIRKLGLPDLEVQLRAFGRSVHRGLDFVKAGGQCIHLQAVDLLLQVLVGDDLFQQGLFVVLGLGAGLAVQAHDLVVSQLGGGHRLGLGRKLLVQGGQLPRGFFSFGRIRTGAAQPGLILQIADVLGRG